MSYNLYICRYNNYFNRQIKIYDFKDPDPNMNILHVVNDVKNFSPGDHLNTSIVINYNGEEPDYAILVEVVSGGEYLIKSRWFVIHSEYSRLGQHEITLRRDIIADSYDKLLEAPLFVEKAKIANIDDPAIFNNEGMTFNQIKQRETLLKDKTGIPWIVGYIPRDALSEDTTVISKAPTDRSADAEISGINNLPFLNGSYIVKSNESLILNFKSVIKPKGDPIRTPRSVELRYLSHAYRDVSESSNLSIYKIKTSALFESLTHDSTVFPNSGISQYFTSAPTNIMTLDEVNDLNGKIYKDTVSGEYYKIIIKNIERYEKTFELNSSYLNYLNSRSYLAEAIESGEPSENTWRGVLYGTRVTFGYEQLQTDVSVSLKKSADRTHLIDQPYDMFCIPYGTCTFTRGEGDTLFISDKGAAMSIATSMSAQLGAEVIIDIQLLPFCPVQSIYAETPLVLQLNSVKYDIIVKTYGHQQTPTSFLIWCSSSDFSLNILHDIPRGSSPLQRKLNNETNKYRLVSPNYSGAFEFNAEKNDGVIWMNVDCSYRPFSPYIHVAPLFNKGSLYGNEYNDARGLICGGDFSLPQVSSAWTEYQLRNKNYQQQFDRQIESLELSNSVQREKQLISATLGTLGGGIAGGVSGAKLGPAGAALGAIGGIATGALGGALDYKYSEMLRQEQVSYSKDQFGYNLQNIQALPQTLNKVSSFNINNKIFPFVELYSCTDIERKALEDKIKYNGYTVMRIGKLIDFIDPAERSYFQAELIRLEDISADADIVSAINDELKRGIYI